jgi:hypothetical protein
MRLLRESILPLALGLILAPAAWAGDDDKKSSDRKGDEQTQTIRGIVSEVTVIGETDVDYKTRKAITAEATYLTIIGHPWNKDGQHEKGGVASADKDRDRDRDVNRTSADSAKAGERPRRRMNVYVVAISPRTKVCECMATGKDGSSSTKEEACDIDKLEIGDHVEVCFDPRMASKSSDDKEEAKDSSRKHGRHRVVFGNATAVKILDEPMGSEHSASNSKEKK